MLNGVISVCLKKYFLVPTHPQQLVKDLLMCRILDWLMHFADWANGAHTKIRQEEEALQFGTISSAPSK